MIKRDEVFKIGRLTKVHGVHGEIVMEVDDDVFDRVDAEYMVLDVDGILVPFFMDEYRFKSDNSALITFTDIDSAEKAAEYTGIDVYFPHSLVEDVPEEEMSLTYFVGFDAFDEKAGHLGEISAVDDATANVLFIIDGKEDEIMIPAHDEFIKEIDTDNRRITFSLPDGMLSLESLESFD